MNPADVPASLSNLRKCLHDTWNTTNMLTCNPGKTEVIHFSSRFLNNPPMQQFSFSNTSIELADKVCDLGVVLDRDLDLRSHINNICRNASLIIRNIGRVRKYLSRADIERLVHAFITSRLDYCNSLLYGLPARDLDKLQHIRNTAARLVTGAKRNNHSDPILRNLHWLPINERLTFKLLIFTYKALNGLAPIYISELLEPYRPPRLLRSAQRNLLKVPYTRTITYGNRAFSYAAPTLWNFH